MNYRKDGLHFWNALLLDGPLLVMRPLDDDHA